MPEDQSFLSFGNSVSSPGAERNPGKSKIRERRRNSDGRTEIDNRSNVGRKLRTIPGIKLSAGSFRSPRNVLDLPGERIKMINFLAELVFLLCNFRRMSRNDRNDFLSNENVILFIVSFCFAAIQSAQ